MDVRYFLLCVTALAGCANTDYATPCDDCAQHGLALSSDTLVVSATGGVEAIAHADEGSRPRRMLGPGGAEICSAPELGGRHLSFACTGGEGEGTWICATDADTCKRLTRAPGRARIVTTRAGVLAIWLGREGEAALVRVFRVGEGVELAWQSDEAYVSSQSTRATHDAQSRGDGARVAWLDRGRRNVQCVDLDERGEPITEPRTWLTVRSGSIATPLLTDDRLVFTHRDTTDAVRAVPLPDPGLVVTELDAETLAEGTSAHPEVAALARASGHLLLGRLRPDGAELSLLAPDGTEEALGFGLGRPVAAALSSTDGGFVAAWRSGARSKSHFDSVHPDAVDVRIVRDHPSSR